MGSELTWEQEQDIRDYNIWRAEEDAKSHREEEVEMFEDTAALRWELQAVVDEVYITELSLGKEVPQAVETELPEVYVLLYETEDVTLGVYYEGFPCIKLKTNKAWAVDLSGDEALWLAYHLGQANKVLKLATERRAAAQREGA